MKARIGAEKRIAITPASDILHALAPLRNFDVRTFQAEDEIAAMGAVIGAAFGGAFSVTGTSGPGIALKSVTAYTQMHNGIYAELGGYKSFSESFLDNINVEPGQKINGLAPYWRLAYSKDMHKQVFSVGLVGMFAKLRDYGTSGPDDKYTDIGIDGHYQFLGTRKHIISVDGSFINESQNIAGEDKTHLNQFNLAGSYYYDKSYGGTMRYFNTTGINGTADTNGLMLQADWTPFGKEDSPYAPWVNLRVGLQYTLYNKLNGDSSNASDGNTIMAFVWAAL